MKKSKGKGTLFMATYPIYVNKDILCIARLRQLQMH